MNLEYKLGFHQLQKFIILPLSKLLAVIASFTYLSIYWFKVEDERVPFVITTSLIWVVSIHIFPMVVMATFHYVRSKNTLINFDKLYKEFTINIKQTEIKFNSDEIEKVVKYLSPPKFDNRIDLLGFGNFYYWVVYLKNGKTIPLSCMLVDSEVVFAAGTLEKKKKMFPIPPTFKR